MNKVAVIGFAQTKFKNWDNLTFQELVFEAVNNALNDARISPEDIDTVVDAGIDLLDGKAISNTDIIGSAGCFLKEEVKLEEDGMLALYYAYLRILSGYHKTALVFGYSKTTNVDLASFHSCVAEPIIHRRLGLNETTALALQANAYREKYKISDEDVAYLLEKNYKNALKNNYYEVKEKKFDFLRSEIISSPLKKIDLPNFTDGACAIVISNEVKNREPIWIKTITNCADSYDIGLRNPCEITSLKIASQNVYRKTGIKSPIDEIDLFEISSPTSYHELMVYEALGLCNKGEGKYLKNCDKINQSGGSLPSYVYVAEGLNRVIECCKKIREGSVKIALAHATCGLAMQSNTVAIFQI